MIWILKAALVTKLAQDVELYKYEMDLLDSRIACIECFTDLLDAASVPFLVYVILGHLCTTMPIPFPTINVAISYTSKQMITANTRGCTLAMRLMLSSAVLSALALLVQATGRLSVRVSRCVHMWWRWEGFWRIPTIRHWEYSYADISSTESSFSPTYQEALPPALPAPAPDS